jgi:AraC-like DNA-binding protein
MSEISFSFVYRILNYAHSKGIDSERLLTNAGIAPSSLTRSDNKLPVSAYFAVLDEAIRQTLDPFFGLHMGEFFEWRDLPNHGYIMNLGYIMASCQTVGHAMKKASAYLGFLGGPFNSEMISTDKQTTIRFTPLHTEQQNISHSIDEALSSFVKIVRSITQKNIHPREVRLPHPSPVHTGEYKRIFSCPVYFNRATTALVFHTRDLSVPIRSITSATLKALPSPPTETIYKDIEKLKEYSQKISFLLYDHLQKGSPCIKQVAKELGMSVRCLQMKLSKEGETFSKIVKDVRKELAKTYLIEKSYSIDEITYLLGFSDPSVFHRAFKNWTGVTPGQYRNTS